MAQEPDAEAAAALLAPLREVAPAAPSTVSVARAVRAAGRRRALQVSGAVAAVVVAALVAVTVPGGRDLPVAAGQFDVLRQVVTVGSAAGLTPASYETGRYRQVVRLRPAPDSPQGTPPRATVTVFAPGRLPGGEPGGTPAPAVHGHRAYWYSATAIAWEWAAGAWAVADVPGARGRAHRVAESVQPRVSAPVRVPFTMHAPEDGASLRGVITPFGTSSDPAAGALLVYGDGPDRVLVGVRRSLDQDFVSGSARRAPRPGTELGGHPAEVTDTAVTIVGAGGGWSVVAEADSAAPPGRDRLVALATAVRLTAR